MSEALIGLIGVAIGTSATLLFAWLREKALNFEKKQEIARLARAELITLMRHTRANLLKLYSLRGAQYLGEQVDFEKLRFLPDGLNVLPLSSIYLLSDDLAQDLLRMVLFNRNNELEIDHAIELVFSRDNLTEANRWEAIEKLIKRMETAQQKADDLACLLKAYERNPVKYKGSGLEWPDRLFQLQPSESLLPGHDEPGYKIGSLVAVREELPESAAKPGPQPDDTASAAPRG